MRAHSIWTGRSIRVVVCVLGLAALGSDYQGCGNAAVPEDGTPLPGTTGTGCVSDIECEPDMCSRFACIRGTCTRAEALEDVDTDGFAPPPCGEDCDDTNADVRPEAPERCDRADNDCDGVIDEDATGASPRTIDDGLYDSQMVAIGDRFAVIGATNDGEIDGYVLSPDGTQGPVAQLVLVIVPGELVERFAVSVDGTRLHIAFARQGRGPEHAVVLLEGADVLRIERTESLRLMGDSTTSLAVHTAFGDTWIAADTFDSTTGNSERTLWRASNGETLVLAPSTEGPALADDGSNLVVNDGDRDLVFLAPAGGETGRQTLTGSLGQGLPLGSDSGAVLVAYRDAFDHLLSRATATSTETPTLAPSGDRTDAVALYQFPEGILFARWNSFQARAWLRASDLRTTIASLGSAELSPPFGGPPSRMSAASITAGTAILSSYPGQSVVTYLDCATAP